MTETRVRPTLWVELFPDEAVQSALIRQAKAFDVRPARFYGRSVWHDSVRRPSNSTGLTWAAAALGLTEHEAKAHTLRANIPKNLRLARVGTRPLAKAGCPRCGYTSYWAALIFVTVCLTCGSPIGCETAPDQATLAAATQMQEAYLAEFRGQRPPPHRISRLHRAFELWRAVSPPELPRHSRLGPRWKEPAEIARFAAWAWPATDSAAAFAALVTRWRAAILRPDTVDNPTPDDLQHLQHQLHEAIRRRGLEVSDIPHVVLARHDLIRMPPAIEDVGLGAARALVAETHCARTGSRLLPIHIDALLGRIWNRPMARSHAEWFRTTPEGLLALLRQLEAANWEPTDYAARRQTLRSLRSVPTMVMQQAGLPADPATRGVAAGWIWTRLTSGSLRTSGVSTKAIRLKLPRFDTALAPEQKLRLAEYGKAVLEAVESDALVSALSHSAEEVEVSAVV